MAARKQTKTAPRRRTKPIDQDLLLAAVARAGQEQDDTHQRRSLQGYNPPSRRSRFWRPVHSANNSDICGHLKSEGRPWDHQYWPHPNQVHAALDRAITAGMVERFQTRSYMAAYYRLSRKGERVLATLKREGRYPQLPPTPAWRDWHNQYVWATKNFGPRRRRAMSLAKKLAKVLESDDPQRLAKLSEFGEGLGNQLSRAIWDLGQTTRRLALPEPPKF